MTFRSRKSRRITAPNGPTATRGHAVSVPATHWLAGRHVGRTTVVAVLTVGAFAAYVLLASNARGAEPGGANSNLRWRARSSAAAQTDATSYTVAATQAAEPARLRLAFDPPELTPIRASSTSGEVQTSRRMHRDVDVVLTQALGDPLTDPFGDRPAVPSPTQTQTPSTLQSPPRIINQPASPMDTNVLPAIPRGDQFSLGSNFKQEECPKTDEFKPINTITNRIAASSGDVPVECPIDDRIEQSMNRPWCRTVYTWKASGLCHKPLYFEEEALERYGHSTGPLSQPLVSAAHFFGTIPVLPYKMGMDPPGECKYALGYYRPGSCAPYIIPGVPISARGIAAQAAVTTGLIYALP